MKEMRDKSILNNIILKMREKSNLYDNLGVFEINLSDWMITWINKYALGIINYDDDQIKHMTVFDITPDVFHELLNELVLKVDSDKFKEEKLVIWPVKTANGKIAWLAVTKTYNEYPILWVDCDLIQITETSGMSFMFMCAFINAVNQTNIHKKLSELKVWTESQILRLDSEDNKIRIDIQKIEEKMNESLDASKESATASKDAKNMMESLQKNFVEFESRYATEILKLIGTDSIHDKRIDSFESHIKMTTDLAVKSIEMQAKNSSEGLSKQASDNSKGLSKKVIIPVSVIALLATIAQLVIEKIVSK